MCISRGLSESDVDVVLGADGGQGKLIVTLAVIPKNEKSGKERKRDKKLENKYKSTSTHRVMVVGRVDSIPETHHNLKTLLEKLNLPELSHTFARSADLKLVDILLGIQSCTSIHSCPYCLGYKVDKFGKKTNGKGLWKGTFEARTWGNLNGHQGLWAETAANKRNLLKHFFNVEFPPIYVMRGQENLPISEVYPPEHLHIGILGPVNDTLEWLEARLDSESNKPIEKFKKKHNMKGGGPGGDLNGPVLKALMANKNNQLDELDKICKAYENFDMFTAHIKNLSDVNDIVTSKNLYIELVQEAISNLRINFFKMAEIFNLSETLKMHIILDHYEDHMKITGKTLLKTTAEWTESTHSSLRKFEEDHFYVRKNIGTEEQKKNSA